MYAKCTDIINGVNLFKINYNFDIILAVSIIM